MSEIKEKAVKPEEKNRSSSHAEEEQPQAKKQKIEEEKVRIVWYVYNPEAKHGMEEHSVMFEETNEDDTSYEDGILSNLLKDKIDEPRENHEHSISFQLIRKSPGDGDKADEILAEVTTYYWLNSSHATLMHFNQLSGDLANFSRELWIAAGRRQREYCDMAIEFGGSRHSGQEVVELVEEATGSYGALEVMYVNSVKGPKAAQLLNLLVEELSHSTLMIAHQSDLSNGAESSFTALRKGWFIALTDD